MQGIYGLTSDIPFVDGYTHTPHLASGINVLLSLSPIEHPKTQIVQATSLSLLVEALVKSH